MSKTIIMDNRTIEVDSEKAFTPFSLEECLQQHLNETRELGKCNYLFIKQVIRLFS